MRVQHPFVLVIVVLTSLAAIALGAAALRLPLRALPRALGVMLETTGIVVGFLAVNVATGVVLVLAGRRLTPYYLTLYEVTDVTLLVLSVLQALAFQAWRHARR